jgi:N utilization substance protein A
MDVRKTNKGPQVFLSRSHPGLVKRLFELEVPEIEDGTVEIKGIAREAGSRTKMAVYTEYENVDPVGSCVGTRGTRVQAIVDELNGEKVDIIPWSEDTDELIANVLSPAKVERVIVPDPDEKMAQVVVPDYQLSLAIGKEGQNARLAARLTGYKIDIKSETQAKDAPGFRIEDYMDDEEDYEGEEYEEGEEFEEGEYSEEEYTEEEYEAEEDAEAAEDEE